MHCDASVISDVILWRVNSNSAIPCVCRSKIQKIYSLYGDTLDTGPKGFYMPIHCPYIAHKPTAWYGVMVVYMDNLWAMYRQLWASSFWI